VEAFLRLSETSRTRGIFQVTVKLVCRVTIEMVNIILEKKRPFFETMTMSWAPAVQTHPGAPQAPVV
jgi:hypothetical protein